MTIIIFSLFPFFQIFYSEPVNICKTKALCLKTPEFKINLLRTMVYRNIKFLNPIEALFFLHNSECITPNLWRFLTICCFHFRLKTGVLDLKSQVIPELCIFNFTIYFTFETLTDNKIKWRQSCKGCHISWFQ